MSHTFTWIRKFEQNYLQGWPNLNGQFKIRNSEKNSRLDKAYQNEFNSKFFYLNSSVMCQVIDTVAAKIIWRVAVWSRLAVLVHKALFTRDILAHNIAIKRYCNNKIFLSHRFPYPTQKKLTVNEYDTNLRSTF